MQQKSKQKLFHITVILESGSERELDVMASNRGVAERRALKRIPTAKVVRRT